jgi:hypothetical protein
MAVPLQYPIPAPVSTPTLATINPDSQNKAAEARRGGTCNEDNRRGTRERVMKNSLRGKRVGETPVEQRRDDAPTYR